MEFISRAGVKLEHALKVLQVDVNGKNCMDVGAATGGFTDCLLQYGAAKVYAIETGYGVLDWKLRNDPKVVVLERTNILYEVPVVEKVDVAVVDTSWTKLKLSVPATSRFMQSGSTILALVKPHYEADKKDLIKGVLKSELVPEVVEGVKHQLIDLGFVVSEPIESPIKGDSGNQEFWLKIVIK